MAEVLCQLSGRSCGACCWSQNLPAHTIRARLRRHTRLWANNHRLGRWRLIWHELRARYFADLWFGLVMDLPWLGPWLLERKRRDSVCAFAGFADDTDVQVVCLIHPARQDGVDVRQAAAFALLPRMSCGPADYLCLGARRFRAATPTERARFDAATRGQDWIAYSRAAPAFSGERKAAQGPKLGAATKPAAGDEG